MTEKKFLTREAFLKNEKVKPKVHEIFIEALDQYVYMKEMSASDQDSYELSIIDLVDQPDGSVKAKRNLDSNKAKYLVRVLCDEKGKRMFKDTEFHFIGEMSIPVIRELHTKALELNRATEKEIEDMEKNSEAGEKDASNSD